MGTYLFNKNLHRFQDFELTMPTRAQLLELGKGSATRGIQDLLRQTHFEVVINLIAETSHSICQRSPETSNIANVEVPTMLLESLRESSHLIHISSDAVFGGGDAPYQVSDPLSPTTSYGAQKAAAENILSTRLNTSILRTAFLINQERGKMNFLRFVISNLSAGKPISGFTDYVNSPISAKELLEALLRVISLQPREALHLGSTTQISRFHLAAEIASRWSLDRSLILPSISPPGSPSFGGLNLSLASEASWDSLNLEVPSLASTLDSLSEENHDSQI